MKLFSVLRSIPLTAICALSVHAHNSGYEFSTLAGQALLGSADGPATTAGFASPNGVAVDKDGNVFVADSYNHTIRKITPAGVVSTLAGLVGTPGSDDGTGRAARFNFPRDVAVDATGNVFVADSGNNTIRKITSDGAVSTLAGLAGATGGVDGSGGVALFSFPVSIAVDGAGNVFVADSFNRTVRKITPGGNVTTLAGLANLSVRCRIGTADQTPIMGFVISDGASKPLLVRGIGPALAPFGVSGASADPRLTLFDLGAHPIADNDNWGGGEQLREVFNGVGAFALDPGSRDAALFATLAPGLYSAHAAAAGDTGGVVLMEAYDLDENAPARLINLSARMFAGSGDDTLIAGFVLTGIAPKTLLIRVAGPSLARLGLGVSGLLIDPKLTLFRGTARLDESDNWGGTAELKAVFQRVGAFEFDSDTSKDAALLVTLQPGVYTAHVTGANTSAGVALVEIYEVP